MLDAVDFILRLQSFFKPITRSFGMRDAQPIINHSRHHKLMDEFAEKVECGARHGNRHLHYDLVFVWSPHAVTDNLIIHRLLLGVGIKHFNGCGVDHSEDAVHSVNIAFLADFNKGVLCVSDFRGVLSPHMPLDIGVVLDVVE